MHFEPDSTGKNWTCFTDTGFYTIRESNFAYIAYAHIAGKDAERLGSGSFQACKKLCQSAEDELCLSSCSA